MFRRLFSRSTNTNSSVIPSEKAMIKESRPVPISVKEINEAVMAQTPLPTALTRLVEKYATENEKIYLTLTQSMTAGDNLSIEGVHSDSKAFFMSAVRHRYQGRGAMVAAMYNRTDTVEVEAEKVLPVDVIWNENKKELQDVFEKFDKQKATRLPFKRINEESKTMESPSTVFKYIESRLPSGISISKCNVFEETLLKLAGISAKPTKSQIDPNVESFFQLSYLSEAKRSCDIVITYHNLTCPIKNLVNKLNERFPSIQARPRVTEYSYSYRSADESKETEQRIIVINSYAINDNMMRDIGNYLREHPAEMQRYRNQCSTRYQRLTNTVSNTISNTASWVGSFFYHPETNTQQTESEIMRHRPNYTQSG